MKTSFPFFLLSFFCCMCIFWSPFDYDFYSIGFTLNNYFLRTVTTGCLTCVWIYGHLGESQWINQNFLALWIVFLYCTLEICVLLLSWQAKMSQSPWPLVWHILWCEKWLIEHRMCYPLQIVPKKCIYNLQETVHSSFKICGKHNMAMWTVH